MELIKRRGALIVVSAPSGAGKTTLCHEVRQLVPDLFYSVSHTTRAPRPGEVNGTDFHFVTEAEFLEMRDRDAFAEWAAVHGHYYGTPKHPALDLLEGGKDVLLEIDVQGALQVRYQYPDALMLFILPPNERTLLQRLTDRGRDDPDDISKRFRAAKREIHMAKGSRAFDYMVFNDQLPRAVAEIQNIINNERAGGI